MLKLLKYLTKQDWGLAVLALVFIVAQVWLDLTMPDYMSQITTLVQTQGSAMSDILIAGGKMLACALGSFAASIIAAICAARIAANFSATLREKLFDQVQSFSMAEIGKFSTASLITRSTNDVMQVQMLIVMGLQVLLKAPIMAVWAICKIAGKSWQWTMSTGVAVAVLLVIVLVCIIVALPKFRQLQKLTDDINRVTRENLTGLNVIRAYNAEDYQEAKFEDANQQLTKTQLFANRTMAFLMPGIQMVMSGLTLAVYWIGAYLVENAQMADKLPIFSDMIVFSQYAMQVVMAFMMLVMIFIILPRASVAAKRILEVLDTRSSIQDGSVTQSQPGKKGEIEFRNVSFRYPDADGDVLQNITFTAHQGETVALIGATGCGKSTVINLIPRFYDVTQGQVLVDGVDVREYNQHALRDKIGYVSQKSILFSGTVKSNVAYGDSGKPSSEEDVIHAVRTAQAEEFVQKLPEEYDGYIAQGGSNLSGGQKQRLSIARAICRRPEIFIFDDSFSALDYKTDRILRQTLQQECGDSTRIMVAQRIGTIRDADKIIVLEDGKIAGMGKHEELMKSCPVYQQIALSQLSKEELAE
ncbi:MAG TPA: ABC transporter ATP-binding protein [Candidatus Egerieicola pullicola]|uniref:ABC transporter ATP-binding protein n=1 Tax=Candidatus Egerieicola pullicola TaxID=2840775 RepID=A0A9D1AIQ0_9FIRM|nr:ABC transporter ATP-binding protein [Candidatus Egerieicola pullicola]